MAEIRSTYPQGASQTNVTMDGRDPALYLQALMERERQQAVSRPPVFKAAPPRPQGGIAGKSQRIARRPGGPRERNANTFEIPWYSQQGAATRPTGLGAQMIPGMAAQQSLLPPNMRTQSSQFQAPTMGPSQAGVTPDLWQEEFFQQYGYWPSQAQGK